MKKLILILFFCALASADGRDTLWRPNPSVSAGLSLTIPGAGQIYNRSYWKAPIAIALEGYSAYVVVDSWREMNELEELGRNLSTGSPEFEQARSDWESARERRNVHSWLFVGFTLLSAIDAYVDAHLYSWTREMSRPISGTDVVISPIFDERGGAGIALCLKFP